MAAYGSAIVAVKELRDQGTANYWDAANAARADMQTAFVNP